MPRRSTPQSATPLMPAPGSYKTPIMHSVMIESTQSPEIIQLAFETESTEGDRLAKLTIRVPIPKHTAALLLGSLRNAQGLGLIPVVAGGGQPKRPN